jgi:hypothetical protein
MKFLLPALLMGLSSAVLADSMAEGPMGGIVIDPKSALYVEQETVEIGAHRVSLAYDLENPMLSTQTVDIHFPLPPYEASGPDPMPAGAPKELNILLDGKPVNFKTTVRAFRNGRDVTAQLHRLGLTDRQIAAFPGQSPFDAMGIRSLTPKQSQQLVKAGLSEVTEACGEDTCFSWEAHVSYDWQVTLPKAGHLHAEVSYVPMASVNVDTDYLNRNRLINEYCASSGKIPDWIDNDGRGPVNGTAVTLNLPVRTEVSDFDVSGVGHFTLRIIKGTPDELVSCCFPGERRQLSPLLEQTDLYNYSAVPAVQVLFGNHSGPTNDNLYEMPKVP